MISVQRLSKKVNGRPVLDNVSFEMESGRIHGIIGPNGVGKSTLLQLLSGVMKPSSGEIGLDGVSMSNYPRKALARRLAVLQQGGLPPAGFTVRQVVEMGRFPYQNWFGDEREDHSALIDLALDSMGLSELSSRPLDQLSGGERQRVALAKVMVQEPEVILLDEPTTYLDIGYQVQLLDTVRQWQRDRGLTVVAVLHDLNLASLYCDQIIVLHQGGIASMGTPSDVLNASLIREVYQTEASIVAHPLTGTPQILLQPRKQESLQEAVSLMKVT
ncbi:iron complex transport system ATP-binding protein [Paenibacillus catalpae]|uniref:Iron complex transport system ATP-binding protein n=1 Tax=Paenibacillus catalpae TaxID=1045775 RepID=A0A1I1UHZ7_9BACL|nr:heme ABC transporter ATP-binding protein [Paenibacillus catalpae]SFD70502.1 iron complex transport system ATP-binding protein [Paenibacillus catalpae]